MNEALQYMRTILFARQGLLVTAEAYASAVFEAFPLEGVKDNSPEPTRYVEQSQAALNLLLSDIGADITLTQDYSSTELAERSIAYHRIYGFITADSWWHFSLKQFEKDLLAAEANDLISCHFLHISSGGGQAWYLDHISSVLDSLKKPIVVFIEQSCCSAAYHIACSADKIFASSNWDRIGCIGTMVDFINWDGYYEKLGAKRIMVRAHQSDLKNEDEENLLKGKPENFITNFLDPMTEEFRELVRSKRPLLKDAPEDEPALRGQTYLTDQAIEKGLVDAKMPFASALEEAKKLADKYDEAKNSLKNEVIKLFNS